MATKDPTISQFWREKGFKAGQSETAPTWTVDRNGNMDVNGTSSFDGTVNLGNVDLITREADGDIINNIAATVLTVFNEQGADIDHRIESDTNSNAFFLDAGLFTGVGAVGIGAAPAVRAFVLIDPPAFTASASTSVAKLYVDNTAALTVPAGTTAIAAAAWFDEPNLTATGTITDAATVYIEAAPTEAGTDNHALWVDGGTTRLDGAVYIGGAVAAPVHALLAAAGTSVFNEGGLDMDFRFESDTNASVFTIDGGLFTGVGGIGLGSAASVAGSVRSDIPAITLTANNSYAKFIIENSNAVTVPAGTAAIVATMRLSEPNITSTGTTSDAYTLIIDAAPTEGTRNGALWVDSGVSRFDGSVLVGDTATPTGMTTGIAIAQAGADDDILTVASSDVAHGVTTVAPTTTYGTFGKFVAASGGLDIEGLSSAANGMYIRAIGTATATDPPTTSSVANFQCVSAAISGTGVADLGATNPIFQVVNNATNGFVVMGDGELYSNQSATVGVFDAYEDDVMAMDLANTLAGREDRVKRYTKEVLEKAGILSGGGMISLNQMHQLELCGIGYLGEKLNRLVAALESRGMSNLLQEIN